jgi:hypothetical protein
MLVFGVSLCVAQPKSELRLPAPVDPVKAAEEARPLVAKLLGMRPEEDATNTGALRIRPREGAPLEVPVRIEIFSSPTNWTTVYETLPTTNGVTASRLAVIHTVGETNQYVVGDPAASSLKLLPGCETWVPFAGSDFWIGDLGLEFLHWPQQRLLKKELRRSRSCGVLESTNPDSSAGGYARVVSWIDLDNLGIVHADAYDAQNKLLKEFDPTEFKKVQGQHQLEEMEMRNRRTGSHTWIKFSLPSE